MTIAKNLINDETVKFESKKHWMAPIQASVVAILMVLGAIVLRWLSPNGDGFFGWLGSVADLVSVGLIVGGIAWIAYNIVAWQSAAFAVTNLRVMREEGLIQHRSSATMLSSLSDVKTQQSFLGKQMAFGDVFVYSQSGDSGVDRFRTITSPMEFRNAIMAEKSSRAMPAAPTPAPAPTRRSARPRPRPLRPLRRCRDDPREASRICVTGGPITEAEFEAKKTELLARM